MGRRFEFERCRHGRVSDCNRCFIRETAVNLAIAVGVFVFLIFAVELCAPPADAYGCRWVIIDGKNVYFCDNEPPPEPEPEPPPPKPRPLCPRGFVC